MASFYNFKVTPYHWHVEESTGLYVIDDDFYIKFDDKRHEYSFKVLKGVRTDGGSIPKAFQGIVGKSWDSYNIKYNACFIAHDLFYGSELVAKDIADDVLRSSLRDCGISRFKAGAIHRAVMLFAKKHYGKQYDTWNMNLPNHGIELDYIRHF